MRQDAGASQGYQLHTLSATLFVVAVGFGIVIPTFPFLVRELGASTFQLGLLTTVYALMQFLFAPVWGSLSDRYGRKRILIAGMAGFGVSYLLMGVGTSYPHLLLARVLGGILSSATLPTAMAFAADVSSEEERGRAMGRMGAALSLGFVFGPTIGGALAPLGVRAPFYVGGAVALLNCLLAIAILKEPTRREIRRPSGRTSGFQNIRLALTSGLAPLFLLILASMFSNSSMFTILPLFLADKMGGDATMAGMVFTVQGATAAVFQWFILGITLRLWGEEGTVLRALVITAVGFLALSLAPNPSMVIAAVIVIASGSALSRPILTSLVSKRTTMMQGSTMGMQTSFDSMGRMLGPMWAGFIYSYSIAAPFWSAMVIYIVVAFLFALQLIHGHNVPAASRSDQSASNPSPPSTQSRN